VCIKRPPILGSPSSALDIGRYPIDIDDVSSLELYKKYAQSISVLVSEVGVPLENTEQNFFRQYA